MLDRFLPDSQHFSDEIAVNECDLSIFNEMCQQPLEQQTWHMPSFPSNQDTRSRNRAAGKGRFQSARWASGVSCNSMKSSSTGFQIPHCNCSLRNYPRLGAAWRGGWGGLSPDLEQEEPHKISTTKTVNDTHRHLLATRPCLGVITDLVLPGQPLQMEFHI